VLHLSSQDSIRSNVLGCSVSLRTTLVRSQIRLNGSSVLSSQFRIFLLFSVRENYQIVTLCRRATKRKLQHSVEYLRRFGRAYATP